MLILSFFANIFMIAVMGQDLKYLQLISTEPFDNDTEKKHGRLARKIIPLRSKGAWTITTVLLVNVACQSYVSILFADILRGEFLGLFVSVPPIVFIGGIIP